MAESILPAIDNWWWSRGQRQGDGGVYLNVGASSTPYDGSAVPVGSRRFTFEVTYTSGDSNQIEVRVNWFNDSKVKLSGPFSIQTLSLAPAKRGTARLEVDLPSNPSPRWLPSILVPSSGHDIIIHSLKVYETPPPPGPATTVWNGTSEVGAVVTVWDGAKEIPAAVEIQA